MKLYYVYNDQPIAEGERVFFYEGGKLYVRTGLDAAQSTPDQAVYRKREVYDATAPNLSPAGGNVATSATVPAGA